MAVAAHFEEATGLAGRARDPRRTLRLEAAGATESGVAAQVLVHNISATGLLIETDVALQAGEKIEIDLPQAGASWAKVIWESGRLFGCQFHTPLSTAALSAAQLRAFGGPELEIASAAGPLAEQSFGGRLQRLRKARSLTLSQVAAALGVSKPTVWAWEQGKARPASGRLPALAAVLGVSEHEIQSGGEMSGLQELLARSREQIARATGASPDRVKILIEL